ncbi:F-box protein [Sesamum alatum]|uniref:F-box protein n=1 Tax=Sesamum alatum TaxID=300844 RepID=A0AAE2CGD6_9LAMI|nr:F-box protein [Sesamum alatum]
MGSIRVDLGCRIHPETIDHFDRLPDSLILLIFNKIGDVKALGRCCVVSRRFHSLVPQVDDVIVRVDCVISDDDASGTSSSSSASAASDKSRYPISSLFRIFFSGIFRPLQSLTQLITPSSVAFLQLNEDVDSETEQTAIPESFYTNGGLKLRVVWTISSLIAASARHYLLQPIIAAHKTLENLVLTDADGQGVLSMNKEQLEELRVKPLSASSASKRTLVPALNMRLWYAPQLELPNGMVLKGATLVAIRPSEQPKKEVVGSEGNWIATAFEEPFRTAARMLVKRRTYCLEMNSF